MDARILSKRPPHGIDTELPETALERASCRVSRATRVRCVRNIFILSSGAGRLHRYSHSWRHARATSSAYTFDLHMCSVPSHTAAVNEVQVAALTAPMAAAIRSPARKSRTCVEEWVECARGCSTLQTYWGIPTCLLSFPLQDSQILRNILDFFLFFYIIYSVFIFSDVQRITDMIDCVEHEVTNIEEDKVLTKNIADIGSCNKLLRFPQWIFQ